MIRCVECGCSRLDSENVGCVLCGGSPSLRTERCHITEDTKAKLVAHAKELKKFGIRLEVEEDKALRKNVGPWVEAAVVVLHVADSLHHGVLRKLVVFLRERKIAEEQIRRLRLDEPEKIMAFYGEDTGPLASHQKRKNSQKRKTNRKPRLKPTVRKSKKHKRQRNRRRK